MTPIKLIAPTLFGIESVTANELRRLGYSNVTVEDGRVTFIGDKQAICRSNLWIRSAERILVKIGEFSATTYDELFENTKSLPWDEWIPEDGAFPVKGYSLKSKLYSVPDCQSIIKKAVVEKLKNKYKKSWFDETGPLYQIQFSLMKDKVTLMIDTSGPGLHKRGYREKANIAPLRETLAAAMILLSRWKTDRPLLDPFCGSGTIPIEAALIGANIAPGLDREFVSQSWPQIPKKIWWDARNEAHSLIKKEKLEIRGSDIDKESVKLSKENAYKANVDEYITFENVAVKDIKPFGDYGCIICNPPYGERMGEKHEVEQIYKQMEKAFKQFDTWSQYILTPHEDFQNHFGKIADKNRKLYNGMIKCYYYQYFGPRF
ncbi:putative RNA methyltransferase YpsC [Tepidanaerobacter acetatoxydans Re1]|uniref:Putative RNA methyltransferase YpsC n=1 Tax=Tepidanaerobacter acetatoxydans (strain DSM 21804 / JCM 16047 / Re1) TaxID=1209989 RepID=F4LSE8_TEPAE|nr:class I SAM-dependent RNA methyltransferase [Tepidanaerobacter acetatoxydans]AEE91214.1 rRNA (guanine-N(2)-)-methyltransferase [Tepidanaerobacter acetatoxydans Re1]CDI40592.1 putative RNA methyltransferase YpsC [Tepidanaerobacter acetatoxydans Re1]